ncbi:MAG: hypothetical protein HN742_19720 [Lentisphaerae bacterium]|jgi:hypothetical protein|nr:hypothetical protein [Lentisphaerota bacterium]MBT5604670.1 hypothetical protein [Lentisphaerota bacterium]MBT7056866.1 hypothetical protein [Lentisphaerota bacterium]MBT7844119.1 hypothetical protein [Lentisphaerota bacterium]
MTQSADNPRRTLSHLKRLMREGDELVEQRPLDELAHAKWLDRARKYLERKIPEMEIPPPWELSRTPFPDLLSRDYRPPHPIDAALARAESGRDLMGQMMVFIAHAAERLEAELEAGT